jgi:zinc transport system substrate-binding protein
VSTLRLTAAGLAVTVALVAGCGGTSSGGSDGEAGRTAVVAAFYPLAFAAKQVGGASVKVTDLTPPGAEPHDVELSPRDVTRVRSADVVLYFGRGFQPALEDALDGADGKKVDLLTGLPLRAGPRGGEEELGADPHVWLDPVLYARVARRIGDAIGRRAPAAAFARRLEALDDLYRRGLARCARRDVVTSHTAFGYLTRRYGLVQIPITGLSPEAEPTPRELARVIDEVRARHATTVFSETLVSPELAQTVARETGAKSAVLDPIEGLDTDRLAAGDTYFSVMRSNLQALRQALGCR